MLICVGIGGIAYLMCFGRAAAGKRFSMYIPVSLQEEDKAVSPPRAMELTEFSRSNMRSQD